MSSQAYVGRFRYVPFLGGWDVFSFEFDPPWKLPPGCSASYSTPLLPPDPPTGPGAWHPVTVTFVPDARKEGD